MIKHDPRTGYYTTMDGEEINIDIALSDHRNLKGGYYFYLDGITEKRTGFWDEAYDLMVNEPKIAKDMWQLTPLQSLLSKTDESQDPINRESLKRIKEFIESKK